MYYVKEERLYCNFSEEQIRFGLVERYRASQSSAP